MLDGPITQEARQVARTLTRYQHDPVGYVQRVLGVDFLWEQMVAILESIRDNPFTAVAACHASSKTFTAACAALWWFQSFRPSKVVTTAPGGRQVGDLLWAEIRKLHGQARIQLPGEPGVTRYQMPDPPGAPGRNADWYATGFSTRPDEAGNAAVKFQGYHSPHLLLIFDEATGILTPIFDAAWGVLTGDHVRWLLLSNPTDPSSRFAEYFAHPDWNAIHIDGLDTPNVKAGRTVAPFLITQSFIDRLLRAVNGDTGSPEYLVKVRGVFPPAASDQLIGLDVVQGAYGRTLAGRQDVAATVGVDVARFGDDRTTIYVVRGAQVIHAERWSNRRTTWTARRAIQLAKWAGLTRQQSRNVYVDDTGVGGGVTDTMVDDGWAPTAVNFGSKPTSKGEELYADRRTELWCNLRNWLLREAHLGDLPDDTQRILKADLTMPKYSFLPRGVRKLESKDQLRKRLGRSPDDGDALALAVADRVTPTPGYGLDYHPSVKHDGDQQLHPAGCRCRECLYAKARMTGADRYSEQGPGRLAGFLADKLGRR